MEGKPTQLPLKELFWGRQGTHPLRPSEPRYSTLRCAADAQSDPASCLPLKPLAHTLRRACTRELPTTQSASSICCLWSEWQPIQGLLQRPPRRGLYSPPPLWYRWGNRSERAFMIPSGMFSKTILQFSGQQRDVLQVNSDTNCLELALINY